MTDHSEINGDLITDTGYEDRQFEVLSFMQNGSGLGFMTAKDTNYWREYFLFRDMDLTSTSFLMTVERITF